MSAPRKHDVDSFGTAFLETMNRLDKRARPSVGVAPVQLLRCLEAGPEPLPRLMYACKMDLRDFAATIQDVEDRGWISVRRVGADEVAELTGIGAQIVNIADK